MGAAAGAAGAGAPGAAAAGTAGLGMARGVGILGMGAAGAAGRGAPGIAICGGAFGASPILGGSGCLGPERICPGLGVGTGRAGIGMPRPTGGVRGAPPPVADSGGRNGNVDFAGAGAGSSGATSARAGSGRVSIGAGSGFAAGRGVSLATGAAGASATAADAGTGALAPFPLGSSVLPVMRRRTSSTTSSSSELECVFLSDTPSSGSMSRITFGLTSSSRANSLMRILLIQ